MDQGEDSAQPSDELTVIHPLVLGLSLAILELSSRLEATATSSTRRTAALRRFDLE
jgi:hypothetical protein